MMPKLKELRLACCSRENDSAWQLVKEAFQRDYKEFVNLSSSDVDEGSASSRPWGQDEVNGLPETAASRSPWNVSGRFPHEEQEDAYRFGYAAYHHFGGREEWNAETEAHLRQNWGDEDDWQTHRLAVRHGWFYAKDQARFLSR